MSATLDDVLKEIRDLRKVIVAAKKPAGRFYTVKETCEALRIGRTKLHDMVTRGQLRKIKRGSKVLFLAIEVEGIIAKEERSI